MTNALIIAISVILLILLLYFEKGENREGTFEKRT